MTTHGSARLARLDDLHFAGLTPEWTPGSMPDGLLIGWWRNSAYSFGPITYKGDLHQLIVGGIGGGKFTTALAPLLLGSGLDDQTVVVIDPKGEIAKRAGPCFQKPFAETPDVFVLDPWDECGTGGTASLSFMDLLTEDNPNCVDDARALAEAMIVPSGNENTHWDTAARNFLAGILLHVALDPAEEGKRNLLRVRDIITLPWTMPKGEPPKEGAPAKPITPRQTLSNILVRYYDPPRSEWHGGAIRRAFTAMLNREEKERSGIISSLDRETAWIDSPAMKKVLTGPSLDLKKAALGGGKYFVVLPANYLMTHRAWLRLCVTAFSTAFKTHRPVADGRPQYKRWRHIVIDEFATLGEMTKVVDDIAIARGYDIKYHLVIQEFPQLERIYQKGWQSFINNSFQRVFAVNDVMTTDYVSQMLGETTVEARSTSSGRTSGTGYSSGNSYGTNEGSSDPSGWFARGTSTTSRGQTTGTTYSSSRSESQTYSESTNEVQRRVMTPDEVRRLPETDQLILMRGTHGIQSWRPPYWEIFPHLPDFTLKDVLGTIGRQPGEGELEAFLAWRRGDPLVKPLPVPEQPRAVHALLPAPEVEPVTRPRRWKWYAAFAALLALVVFYETGRREQAAKDEAVKLEAARIATAKADAEIAKVTHARQEALDAYTDDVARRGPMASGLVGDIIQRIARSFPRPDPDLLQPEVKGAVARIQSFQAAAGERVKAQKLDPTSAWQQLRQILKTMGDFHSTMEGELAVADQAGKADAVRRILAPLRAQAETAASLRMGESKLQRLAEAKTRLANAAPVDALSLARRLSDETVREMASVGSAASNPVLHDAVNAGRAEIDAAGPAARHARADTLVEDARAQFDKLGNRP